MMEWYERYKDSGVEWIGEVPEEWKVKPFKRCCRVKRGASPRPIEDEKYFEEEGEYAWVRIADVTASEKYLLTTTQRLSKLGASLSVKMEPNSIFLSIAGSVGKPIITKIKCCIHDGFVWFEDLKLDTTFLYYLFISGRLFEGLGKLGTQLNLNTETVGSIRIPVPSDEEQTAIARYLDAQTAAIDEAVRKKEALAQRLERLRQSVIHEAVTGGLDAGVAKKASGVEWLGEVPGHWEVMPLKRVMTLLTDYDANGSFSTIKDNVNRVDAEEDRFAWMVRATDLENLSTKTEEDFVWVDEKTFSFLRKSSLQEGDLLIAKRGEIGKVYLMPPTPHPATLGPNMYLLRFTDAVSPRFLFYYFFSPSGREQLATSNLATTIGALYKEEVRALQIALPSLEEQTVIVAHLDAFTARIDALRKKLSDQIARLRAYRSSLIAEVVTGKRRVVEEVVAS